VGFAMTAVLNKEFTLLSLLVFGIGYGLTRMMIPFASKLFVRAGWVRENWQKKSIPSGVGFVCAVPFLLLGALLIRLHTYFPGIPVNEYSALLIWTSGMTLFGWLDDRFGTREVGGFLGHFRKLMIEGEMTTGLLKAIGGAALSLGVAILLNGEGYVVLIDGMTMALMANAINLLDVKPGRAIKGVLLVGISILVISRAVDILLPLLLLFGVMLAFFPADMAGRVMLGDTGANFLGAVLGFLLVCMLDVPETCMLLMGLVAFHMYTEYYSLSELIENNRFLRWLDEWGRGQSDQGNDDQRVA
jgi:UDP-GlcNAc:undecaprenyl-phosphate/decaprenyl-phosphate GlcNAc-1-phosphate transferase